MQFIKYNKRRYGAAKPHRDLGRIKRINQVQGFFDFDVIQNKHLGETAYLLAPGTTLNKMGRKHFQDKLTIGVNSAGFWQLPSYWVVTEGAYAKYLNVEYLKQYDEDAVFALSLRAAHNILKVTGRFFSASYIMRFRGIGYFPPIEMLLGETILSAIGLAWWIGCKRCYIFGLDFGAVSGKCYAEGIPPKPAPSSHRLQIPTIQKFEFKPELEIINVNEYSYKLPFVTTSLNEYKQHG